MTKEFTFLNEQVRMDYDPMHCSVVQCKNGDYIVVDHLLGAEIGYGSLEACQKIVGESSDG